MSLILSMAFRRWIILIGAISLSFWSRSAALAQNARSDQSADSRGCCGLTNDPSDPRILYATMESGLFRSIDGGSTWLPLFFGGIDIAILAPDSRDLLVLSETALVRSRDGGATWDRLAFPAASTWERDQRFVMVERDPANPETIYLVDFHRSFVGINTSGSVYKSTDGGANWIRITEAFVKVATILIDGSAPQRLYVARYAGGISRSDDSGTTWSTPPPGLYATFINSLVADPRDFSVLYDGSVAGVFKSIDAGETWESANNGIDHPYPVIISKLTIAPSRPAELLASTTTSDGLIVYRTDDGARTWREFLRGVTVLAIDAVHPETLYIAKNGRLLKSTDDGLSAVDITPSYERRDTSPLPSRPSTRILSFPKPAS